MVDNKITDSPIIKHLLDEFGAIQSSGANAKMLNQIMVAGSKHEKSQTPLRDMSIVTKNNSQTLQVVPFDLDRISDVDRAIMSANLGVQTIKYADSVMVIFPTLSEERRKELVKIAKQKAEEARVSVRQLRKKSMQELKDLSKDKKKQEEKNIQKTIDQLIEIIDQALIQKEKSILFQ